MIVNWYWWHWSLLIFKVKSRRTSSALLTGRASKWNVLELGSGDFLHNSYRQCPIVWLSSLLLLTYLTSLILSNVFIPNNAVITMMTIKICGKTHLWICSGRLSSVASLPQSCPALAGENHYPGQHLDIFVIRVYGIAGRGTALIAVSGKGSFYDPPVRVSFHNRSYIWQCGNMAIWQHDNDQEMVVMITIFRASHLTLPHLKSTS